MAKIQRGKNDTRIIPVKSTQVLDHDATDIIEFDIEVKVLSKSAWATIRDRWAYLSKLKTTERVALEKGLAFEPMTDIEREEADKPALESVKHLIINTSLEIEVDGRKLEGQELIDDMCDDIALDADIFDAICAVQAGKTFAAYKQARQGN